MDTDSMIDSLTTEARRLRRLHTEAENKAEDLGQIARDCEGDPAVSESQLDKLIDAANAATHLASLIEERMSLLTKAAKILEDAQDVAKEIGDA